MQQLKVWDWIAIVLVVVGGLNWLLFAFGYNLVEAIFGTSILATIVYVLVGISAIYLAYISPKLERK